MEAPVGEPLDPVVAHAVGELGHRLRPEVAAVGDDGRDRLAHVAGAPFASERERAGKAERVVDLDQEVRQPDPPHPAPEPRLQLGEPGLSVGVERVSGIGSKPPPVVLDRDVRVGPEPGDEPVVGRVQAGAEESHGLATARR